MRHSDAHFASSGYASIRPMQDSNRDNRTGLEPVTPDLIQVLLGGLVSLTVLIL